MDQSLTRKVLALFALISIGICQQYFGGELRTKESYLYGRFEARFKSAQGDGLVSSFFTYQDERINGGHIWNEIDIEVLGRWENIINMNTVNLAISAKGYIENFTPHTEYYDYAFEWTPTYVAWFVNGEYYPARPTQAQLYSYFKICAKNNDEPLGTSVRRLGRKVER